MSGRSVVTTVLTIFTLVFVAGSQASAQQPGCTKDTDCKGERICEDARCIWPDESAGVGVAQPLPPEPPPPGPAPADDVEEYDDEVEGGMGLVYLPDYPEFYKFYVTLGWAPVVVQIMDWDDYDDRPDRGVVSLFPFNFRLAGYGALNENIFLGGFFTYEKFVAHADASNSMDMIALGVTGRLGGRTGPTLWVGVNLDIGATLLRDGRLDAYKKTIRTSDYNFYAFPAICVIKSFGSDPGLNGGIEFMMGLELYAGKQASYKDHGAYQHFSFGPSIRIGFLMGGI